MSWANELKPPELSLRSLLNELISVSRSYFQSGLPLKDLYAFVGLRIVQRLAYNAGWASGLRLRTRIGTDTVTSPVSVNTRSKARDGPCHT